MLKHQEIIDKLTIEQKIDLIANASSLGQSEISEDYKFLKIRTLKKEKNWLGFPSFNALAKSWDPALIEEVSSTVLTEQKKKGVNLVELPSSRVKTSPYSAGVSEDPYLTGSLVSAVASAGKISGVSILADSPLLSQDDVAYSDIEPNERAIQEYFNLPHRILSKNNLTAIKMPLKKLDGKYGEINEIAYQDIASKNVLVCDSCEGDAVKEIIENGKIFLNANKTAITDAYENYLKLMKAFDLCEIGLSDIHKACEKGVALNPETIDLAVDTVLDFTDRCNSAVAKPKLVTDLRRKKGKNQEENDLAYIATKESTVLLKNLNQTLPLSRGNKVCLIGSLAEGKGGIKENFEARAQARKIKLVGYEKGYGGIKERDDSLIEKACALASKSDVAIVVLGYNEEGVVSSRLNRNSKIPANQEELIEKLRKTTAKIVVLLVGDCLYDMSFDKYAHSVMLLPAIKGVSVNAVIKMIYGGETPSGRLTNTLYENTDDKFTEIKNYKDAGRNKIGLFYGYRQYDSGNYVVKYPFGYGLSYTTFKYSNLKISNGRVSCEVKNVGKNTGSETVQIYIGYSASRILRPKKELKGFYKVCLKPKQKKKITFSLTDFDLKVFDKAKNKFLVEMGRYEIYVCSSVSKVELQGKTFINGVNFERDGEKKSSYFQKLSNIKDGQYYLEEPIKMPKYTEEGKLRGAVFVSFAVVFLDTIYLYLYSMKWLPGNLIYFIVIAALTFLPIMTALTLKSRKQVLERKYILESKKMKRDKLSKIDPEEINEEIPYEQLFIEEFEEPEVEVEDNVSTVEDLKDKDNVVQYTFNPELTAKKACDEFTLFLKERDVLIDVESMRSLFAAMSSSRMIFINYENKDVQIDFIQLLSKYFNCELISEDYDQLQLLGGDIITASESGITSIAKALMDVSTENENKMRIMNVNNVLASSVKDCVSQIFRYLDQPTAKTSFLIRSGKEEGRHDIPNNVWFTFVLKEGEKLCEIPRHILESACIVNLVLRSAEEPKEVKKPRARKKEEKVEEAIEDLPLETIEALPELPEPVAENAVVEATVSEEVATATEQLEKVEEISEEAVAEEVQDPEANKTPVEVVEFYQFEKLIEYARRDFELSENLWKRLDKLEEYVQSLDSSYKINNKLWLRLEKYVSMYLSVGGVEEEALDSVVAHYIINTMISSVANAKSRSEKFTVTLENIFGEGHVPHSIKAVKATGLKI